MINTPELKTHPDPFEGIDLFQEEVRAVEVGERGENGWFRAEYYPRTDEFRVIKIKNRTQDSWIYNRRTISYYPCKSESIPVIQDALMFLEDHGIRSDVPEGYGFPEVEEIVIQIQEQIPQEGMQDLMPDNYYLIRRKDGKLILFKIKEAERRINRSGGGYDQIIRIYSAEDAIFGLVHALAIECPYFQPQKHIGETVEAYFRRSDTGELDREFIAFPVTEEQAKTIAAFKPVEYDPALGDESLRKSLCTYVSLQALQFTRWAQDEEKGKFWKPEQATVDNYRKALNNIIGRFGLDVFADEVEKLFLSHLKILHVYKRPVNLNYKPHSDIAPLDKKSMYLARQVTRGVYPFPEDMGSFGKVVNVATIFGDANFWSHMRENYPALFSRFVDYIKSLPKDFQHQGIFASSTINPVALIQNHFPEAYAEIVKTRPDFVSAVYIEDAIIIHKSFPSSTSIAYRGSG